MALLSAHWTLAFGLLGNVVSFMVFLAPIPTFYKIYKKKSTEGFQSVPYVVGLFSAMLWIYYALLKSNTLLLITINSVGCVFQAIFICIFLFYAPKKARMQTMKLLVSMNVVGFGLIVILTQFLVKEALNRVVVVGWLCLVFSLCVFVAPLCVVRQVIKTKSVEYMPFLLSFFLTLSAVMWFFYGLLLKDYNIAIPNVLGFTFGVLQMVLYMMYKDTKKIVITKTDKLSEVKHQDMIIIDDQKLPEFQDQTVIIVDDQKLPELKEKIMDVMMLSALVCSEIKPVVVDGQNLNGANVIELQVVVPKQSVPLA